MQPITVKDRQNFVDIAMQSAGGVEAALAVAEANGMSITDDLQTGQTLASSPVIAAETVNTFYKENRSPATTETVLENVLTGLSGIDYWGIEDSFIVS